MGHQSKARAIARSKGHDIGHFDTVFDSSHARLGVAAHCVKCEAEVLLNDGQMDKPFGNAVESACTREGGEADG